jgi:hypothetical protein
MKLPSSWHANAAVCALAFTKLMAVRQSSLGNQVWCDEIHRLPSSFHSPRNAVYVCAHPAPVAQPDRATDF